MATEMILRINRSLNDIAYADQISGQDYYTAFETGVDKFYFSEGSVAVSDGEPIPSEADLNRAATLLSAIDSVEVNKYFLGDITSDLLREIFLAGSGNCQYVFCCCFDGATASEPQLEAWDDFDLDSFVSQALGLGTPANSWYRAICTTISAPGTSWSGTPLAGGGASNVELLNGGAGALSGEGDLYFNFHILIPAGITTASIQTPVLCVTFTTN